MYKLTKLEKLNLEFNHISRVSDRIANLCNLKTLNLSVNDLNLDCRNGCFNVRTIAQLSTLETLCLDGNYLTALPQEIKNLRNLKRLDLSSNFINCFPSELWSLGSLVYLNLAHCNSLDMKKADDKRCKILPVDVGLLKNLQYLDISGMCLDEIPFDALASLPQLQELRIYGNSEAITLPGDIGSLRQSIKQGVYLA